jgi:hypothetical protein
MAIRLSRAFLSCPCSYEGASPLVGGVPCRDCVRFMASDWDKVRRVRLSWAEMRLGPTKGRLRWSYTVLGSKTLWLGELKN